MSLMRNCSAALLVLACTTGHAHSAPNDLLINEQWGLDNRPQGAIPLLYSAATSGISAPETANGTCAKKPVIEDDAYQCNRLAEAGVEDVDINAPEGWAAYSASAALAENEVVIGLIDTGIDYGHPDLAQKIWQNPGEIKGQDSNGNQIDDGCEDGIDGDGNGYADDCHGINAMEKPFNTDGSPNRAAGDPIDDTVGHGTNMAGVMAAVGNNQNSSWHGGIVGVAGIEPRIKIAACKSARMESDVLPLIPGLLIPAATEESILRCLDYFHDLKQRGINIAVINASGGMSKYINLANLIYPLVNKKYRLNTPAMHQMADVLEQDDIVVVAAAGNFSWDLDSQPSARAYFPAAFPHDNIITVGAINHQGNLWAGSSYGRWSIDVFAPGQNILSTNPRSDFVSEAAADFVVSDGSSQATAYVSGVIALLRANADTAHLDAKALRRLLISSGKTLPAAVNKSVAGSLVRLADSNGRGALTCDNQIFRRRLQPQTGSAVRALPGETIHLEMQNFNCAQPGNDAYLTATVSPGNQTIQLLDDGTGGDLVAGDGIYSADWTVPAEELEYSINLGMDSVTISDDILTILPSIIVDNGTSTTRASGFWLPSVYRPGFYGNNYSYATASKTVKRYSWAPQLAQAGWYKVYARWPESKNFAHNAPYQVHHQNQADSTAQVTEIRVDQTANGKTWMELGEFWFDAGAARIELTNINADGTVVADAIQLVPLN